MDDDRRQKTVYFQSDTPDSVIDMAEAEAAEDKMAADARSNTESLDDAERERIKDADGFDTTTTTANWRSAKGVFAREGLTDQFRDAIGNLADYDDPIEGAEEYTERYQRTGQGGGGRDVGEEDQRRRRKEERAAQRVQGEGCNHAEKKCRHGAPDACEFLTEACGFSEEEVDRILSVEDTDDTEQQTLVTVGGGEYAEMEVTPEQAGALQRSWQGYKGAVSRLGRELDDVREAVVNARQAMTAINRIREENGHDDLHPDRLHGLVDVLVSMPESIPEIRRLDHFADYDGDGPGGQLTDSEKARHVTDMDPLEADPQRDLSGDRANDQARFSAGERGEDDGETIEDVEENPGGLEADEREETNSEKQTKQARPDAFRVAEGGQRTL